MTRVSVAGVLVLALTLVASPSGAQVPAGLPWSPPDDDAAPPPTATKRPRPHTVDAPASTVRIHSYSADGKHRVRVEMPTTSGEYRLVCTSSAPAPDSPRWGDCVADVPPGSQLRVTLGNVTQPQLLSVPDDPGSVLDLEVLPAEDSEAKVGGTLLIVLGSAGMCVGLLSLAAAGLAADDAKGRAQLLGGLGLVLGGLTVAGGIALIKTRPKEPRVVSYDRSDNLLGDVAAAKSRDRATDGPAAFTPLRYGFTF